MRTASSDSGDDTRSDVRECFTTAVSKAYLIRTGALRRADEGGLGLSMTPTLKVVVEMAVAARRLEVKHDAVEQSR